RAWVTPTVTVDSPSPAGVGLIPVTSTSRPVGLRRAKAWSRIFALYFPYSSISSSASPSSVAISATGRSFAAWAIAMSVGTLAVVVTGPLGLERGSEPRSEQPPRVLRRARSDRLERLPAGPGECLGHLAREPRLVPPAAMRHGGEVGCVRLNQEPVCRTVGQSDRGVPVPERDHAREGKIRADGHPRLEHLRARAERVQHDDRPDAGGPRPLQHRRPTRIERPIAQMAVGVDQVGARHWRAPTGWAAAGEPAVPAQPTPPAGTPARRARPGAASAFRCTSGAARRCRSRRTSP